MIRIGNLNVVIELNISSSDVTGSALFQMQNSFLTLMQDNCEFLEIQKDIKRILLNTIHTAVFMQDAFNHDISHCAPFH